tara:strand:+ start:1087 stop:1557 length:471 start_codon:yes stop_codon:yes gene_type:complete
MYEYNARILRVVDGDTVDVDIDLGFGMAYVKQRVRMLGIDTPESRTRDLEEKRFGLAAKKYVQKYLKVGEKYKLKTALDKGKYGRILGEFFVTEPDVHPVEFNLNQEMIKDGYGVAYYGQSKEEIEASHLENRKILLERGDYIPMLDKRGKEIKQM